MKTPDFSCDSFKKLTLEFNLYAEVDRSVRSKRIPKVNKPKSLHWSVQNWKRLQKCYSIAHMHHKTASVVAHQKRPTHRQPGFHTNCFLYMNRFSKKKCFYTFFDMYTKNLFVFKRKKFHFECYVKSFVLKLHTFFSRKFCVEYC